MRLARVLTDLGEEGTKSDDCGASCQRTHQPAPGLCSLSDSGNNADNEQTCPIDQLYSKRRGVYTVTRRQIVKEAFVRRRFAHQVTDVGLHNAIVH